MIMKFRDVLTFKCR